MKATPRLSPKPLPGSPPSFAAIDGELEYAAARLAARLGKLPDERLWARLHACTTFAAFAEAARNSALKPWIAFLREGDGVHEIERGLRAAWRGAAHEAASWLPGEWRPALQWCAHLCDLPALAYLARGEQVLEWMSRDPALRPWCADDAAARAGALQDSPLAPLRESGAPLEVWLAAFRALWPEEAQPLEELVRLLAQHQKHFRETAPAHAWQARAALSGKLRLLFHRHAQHPAAAFAYCALLALELEKLRGELVLRRVFPAREAA